ncbi:DUF6268 family outer membrane beta-barrel protein [Thalassobellus citreus]|uniref:DUF6268 family outer membrane beta-barrel protein n=1 Tax=Thalassobellus citreus TaxID=3367752 RepID=UPI0037A099D9
MKRIIMVAFIISVANKSFAQLKEHMFSFNYSLAPIGGDEVDFYKTDLKANIPVKLKKGKIINSIGFDYYQLNYTNDYSFATANLTEFYNISYGLNYIYPISNTVSISAKAEVSIASNLINTVSSDDLLLLGDIFLSKKIGGETGKGSLIVGASYNVITGKPNVLPIVSYTKQVNNKFSYSIGYPKTYANYKMSPVSSLKSFLSIDGVYANLNSLTYVNTMTEANKASFTTTSLGLEYDYIMDGFWSISFKGGYSVSNKYTLLNNNDDEVFDFNTVSKPFLSAGIKFNLKSKNKN